MRFYKVSEGDKPVAVVFHDYLSGVVICRSKYESFLKSFEVLRNVGLTRFSKEVKGDNQLVRLVAVSETDYGYVDYLFNHLLGDFWKVVEVGDCVGNEETIDQLVDQFLQNRCKHGKE